MTNKIIEAARSAGFEWSDLGIRDRLSFERFYAIARADALEDAAKVATQIDLESQGVLPIRVALISSRIAKSILALKEQQHG